MTAGCATCNQKCGKGKASTKTKDGVMKAMCKILCKVRMEMCQGKHKGKKASAIGEKYAKTDPELDRAIKKKYPKGKALVNKQRFVKFDGAPKKWNRMKVAQKTLDRQMDKIEKQIKKKVGKVLATKAAKKAATAWIKFIPVLNVASTLYDVYDFASTGAEVYKEFQKMRQQFSGDVYRVRPDVAVVGENGQMKDIYDFKFDGDQWQPGQKELYERDLKDSKSGTKPKEVNSKNCGCDGPKTVARTG